MVDIEFIRKRHFVDGWSIRKLSRQLGIARQTVRKALASAEPPRYRLTRPRPCPVMDPYGEVILAWLKQDETAPRKQRHTARRIYHRLVEEFGFRGSESAVSRYVARLRARQPEPYLPLTAAWGQMAQVDWGEALWLWGGRRTVAHVFVLRLRASGVCFAWAAPTERLEAFLEGHVRAFAWLGGVPHECVYDNPTTTVVKILAGPERDEHTLFASLRAHYLFDSLFCRPGEAHEKGSVENGVGYVRRNALVPMPEFADWDELNAHLLAWCERDRERRREAWRKERAALRPLPEHPFRPARLHLLPVSKLSLVTFDRNRYSVPCELVGRTVQVWAYTNRIEITDGACPVAVHRRAYGRGETVLELAHYLPALQRKPRAAAHLAVVPQLPPVYAQVQRALCSARRDGYREFAQILLLHREFPAEAVTAALQEAADHGLLQADAVRQLILNRLAPPPPAPIVVPAALATVQPQPAEPARYDALLAGRWGDGL